MRDSTLIKIIAITGLVVLEIVNFLTMKIDGNVLITVSSIIGGIAGYEFGKRRGKD